MKVFLAGTEILKNYPDEIKKSKYILASFFSINEWQIPFILSCEDFLLDSGAFTFINKNKGNINFDKYIDEYADFIKKYNIKNYFELDIDAIVGYEKVLEYRRFLEKKTQTPSIPVWHKSRGLSEFRKMCDEYDYVAIGGIVTKEINKEDYKYLPSLIKESHKRNAKIHGLGFTSTSYFNTVHFDTVDSTTWNVGGKFGNVCVFDKNRYMTQRIQQKGKRCIKQEELMIHNWNEWIKFQKYADTHL